MYINVFYSEMDLPPAKPASVTKTPQPKGQKVAELSKSIEMQLAVSFHFVC